MISNSQSEVEGVSKFHSLIALPNDRMMGAVQCGSGLVLYSEFTDDSRGVHRFFGVHIVSDWKVARRYCSRSRGHHDVTTHQCSMRS